LASSPPGAAGGASASPAPAHPTRVPVIPGGDAALSTTDGPEKNTLQWAADGINFEIQAVIKDAPHALGPFRTPDHDKGPLEGVRWGLRHAFNWRAGGWGYIQRFHVDETLKDHFLGKATYE